MPLSGPAPRKLIYMREIRCTGFEREYGLLDIEGRITDVKSYGFETQDRAASMPPTVRWSKPVAGSLSRP